MRHETIRRKKISILLLIGILLILISTLNYGLILGTRINSGSTEVTSDQELTCYWTLDVSTNANVTWYLIHSGITTQNRTQTDISCTATVPCSTSGDGNIPQSYTVKGDSWVCKVSYVNLSVVDIVNVSVSIINSPPTPARVYLQNGSETTNNTAIVPEDSTTQMQVNSTDADGDSLTYTLNDTTFCTIGAVTGILQCTPTLESHIGVRSLHIGAQDSNSAQFIDLLINVTPTNDPPSFSPALSNRIVSEGSALNLTLTAIDDENDFPINFTLNTNLTSLILLNASSTTATLKFNNSGLDIARFTDRGNYTVIITIFDSGSPSRNTTGSFNIEVLPNNHLPNVSIYILNNNSISQGGNLSLYVNATDIDNDTLVFYTNSSLYNITYTATDQSNPTYSFASGWINISILNNSNVLSRYITLTTSDGKESTSNVVFLNITNTNDPPTINEISHNSGNSLSNINLSSLVGYTGVQFSYYVNGSDIDSLTYESEVLTYSTNDSNFPINSSTGRLYFTPLSAGNYTFRITLSDDQGLTYNSTANIDIMVNTNPRFTQTNISIQCFEYDSINHQQNCTYNLSSNVTDDDLSDYVADFWTNSSIFNISSSTGVIQFSPDQGMIGNYTIQVNITDTRGGRNYTTISMNINNTNDVPSINNTALIPSGRLRIGTSYEIRVYAFDEDLSLPNTYENLSFNISVSGPNPSLFSLSKISNTEASIGFLPTLGSDAGNYTISVTATDSYGNVSSPKLVNLYIYNTTLRPSILLISPFGSPIVNGSVNTSFANKTSFIQNRTNITILENSSYLFNQTAFVDDSVYQNDLIYTWEYDGNTVSIQDYLNLDFNFTSAGNYTLRLFIEDKFNYTDNFTWYIKVNNVNRPPRLETNLENISVNGTTTFDNYMAYYNGLVKFIDDDDDSDLNGRISDSENHMTFSATSCGFASFSFTGTDLKVTTTQLGECYVNFTAIDSQNSSLNATDLMVLINITEVSNETTEVPTPTPRNSGGGGGSSTRTITIPLPLDVEKPKPLQLITPKLVTIYKNATIKVPIVLNNTWNDSLRGVTLAAYTNATNVSLHIDKRYFASMAIGESQEVILTIENYKSEGHYEIQVYANVTDPDYREVGTIFVNSAEMKSEGDELENKISFARDLLSSNPECQELNEILNEAKKQLDIQNYQNTAKLVDNVINGCRYLVSSSNKKQEKPATEFMKTFEWRSEYQDYLIVGGFAILFLISLIYLVKKERAEDY